MVEVGLLLALAVLAGPGLSQVAVVAVAAVGSIPAVLVVLVALDTQEFTVGKNHGKLRSN